MINKVPNTASHGAQTFSVEKVFFPMEKIWGGRLPIILAIFYPIRMSGKKP